ncbi:MAG: hypothetical protein AB1861_08390 [Cyanobacteriota bacterium]
MIESLLSFDLYYQNTGTKITPEMETPKFIRGDSISIVGRVYGKDLTGLSAKLTARMVLPDGSTGPAVITKTSAASGGITLTTVNPSISGVQITLSPEDTSAFDDGQKFVFDIEFSTTTTPPVRRSVKSRFVIEEDYTLTAAPSAPAT